MLSVGCSISLILSNVEEVHHQGFLPAGAEEPHPELWNQNPRDSEEPQVPNHTFRISEYYETGAIRNPADPETRKSCIADSGAFVAFSGNKSGRSPKDKRIVTDSVRQGEIWWGEVNAPLESHNFQILRDTAISYLNTRPKVVSP